MTHKDSDTNGQLHTKRGRHLHLETHRHIHRLPIPHKQENTETHSATHTYKTLTQTHSPAHPHSYPSMNEVPQVKKCFRVIQNFSKIITKKFQEIWSINKVSYKTSPHQFLFKFLTIYILNSRCSTSRFLS